MIRCNFASAMTFGVLSLLSTSTWANSKCVERETYWRNYPTTRAWLDDSHAASVDYIDCLKREGEERDRKAAERKAAREEEDQRQQALSNAVKNAGPRGISMSDAMSVAKSAADKVGERITSAIISAPGDKALGAAGPRDATVDRVGNAAVKAVGHVDQPNAISAKLTDIAVRSAVDVNSRAIGSLQAGMKDFGGIDAPSSTAPSLPPPRFAHVSNPSTEPDLAAFSGALGAAAHDIGARGMNDMRVSEQQLQRSGLSDRVGNSVRNYNASIDRSNEVISAQLSADARSLERYHEFRDEARANAATHTRSSTSSGRFASGSGSSTINASKENCGSEKYGCGVNGRGELVDAKGNVYGAAANPYTGEAMSNTASTPTPSSCRKYTTAIHSGKEVQVCADYASAKFVQ